MAFDIMKAARSFLFIHFFLLLLALSWADTFAEAIKTNGGGTFDLAAGTVYTAGTYISKDTVINGNGAIIQLSGGQMISVGAGAKVVFQNVRISGGKGLYINNAEGNEFAGYSLTIENSADSGICAGGGKVTLESSVFKNCNYGLNLYAGAIADSVSSCTFQDISNTAILLNEASVREMRECIIRKVQKNGINASGASDMSIINCRFEDNKRTDGTSYVMSIKNSANILVDSSDIIGADVAILMKNCTNFRIQNSRIRDCDEVNGTGVSAENSIFSIQNCEFNNCSFGTNTYGGSYSDAISSTSFTNIHNTAILINSAAVKSITHCATSNVKKNAIQATSTTKPLTINECQFENTRSATGGAYCLSLNKVADLTLSDTHFLDSDVAIFMRDCLDAKINHNIIQNSSKGSGLIADHSTLSMADCEFTSCTIGANFYGGSVVDSLSNTTFKNMADSGVIVMNSSLKSFRNCRVENAVDNAFYAASAAQISIIDSVFEHTAASNPTNFLLSLEDCQNLTILGSTFKDGKTGIYLQGCALAKVENSVIKDCKDGSGIIAADSRIRMFNNRISNSKYGLNMYDGTIADSISSCTFSTFSNSAVLASSAQVRDFRQCVIAGAARNGFMADSASEVKIADCLFEKNIASSGVAYSISFKNTSKVSIDNTIFRNSDMAVFLNRCPGSRLQNLMIMDCSRAVGILLLGTGCSAEIINASVTRTRAGLAVMEGASAKVRNCLFRDSYRGPARPYQGQGVYVMMNSRLDIADSIITGNDNEGIYCETSPTTVTRCLLADNGWDAHDGNGLNFIDSAAVVVDTKVTNSYLFGIQAMGEDVLVRGCELRGNRKGGINVGAGAVQRNQRIFGTIADGNCAPEVTAYELNCNSSQTAAVVANCLFSSNPGTGVFIQKGSHAALSGNIIYGNAKKSMNVYMADVDCTRNVFAGSQSNIFLNGAPLSKIKENDILDADSGADRMGGSIDDFRDNWWGSVTGPYNPNTNAAGKGTRIYNTTNYNPWRSKPVSYFEVFRNYSLLAGQEKVLSSSKIPFAKIRLLSGTKLTSQILAVQASTGANLFPHLALPSGLPAKTVYMWIAASQESRLQTMQSIIELNTTGGTLSELPKTKVLKYDSDKRQWVVLDRKYSASQSLLKVTAKDIFGAYLIVGSGYTSADSAWSSYQ